MKGVDDMSVPQFTTPTFTLTFEDEGLDLTDAVNVYVTFSMAGLVITKTGEDLVIEPKSIDVYLSQRETAQFGVGSVEIQANWTSANGNRAASDIVRYTISKQLLRQVVE